MPECVKCSCTPRRSDPIVRDITHLEITTTEVRHRIHTATCDSCKTTHQAPNDLPVYGSYGKNRVAMVTLMRMSRMPFKETSRTINELTGIYMSKSTIINITGRTCDAMEKSARAILGNVKRSKNAGMDETPNKASGEGISKDGSNNNVNDDDVNDKTPVKNTSSERIWAWVLQSKTNIVIIFNKSRGSYVLDAYMDKYKEIVTSDKLPVYNRFNLEDHQPPAVLVPRDPAAAPCHRKRWRNAVGEHTASGDTRAVSQGM